MSNNKLFRTAGWCALVGALSMVAAVVSFIFSGAAPIAGMVGGILEYISLLLLVFVFYALSIAHRSESKGLGLAGLILLIVAIVVDVVAYVNYGNTILSNLWFLLLSLPFLIFGFLAFRSARMPRGLAVVALLAGVTSFISGVGGLLGNQAIADNVGSFPFLFMLIWEVWLWLVFVSKKFATASPEPAAA
jgi:hypothetical protein